MKITTDPLYEAALYSALGQYASRFKLCCVEQCASTNTELLQAPPPGDERVPVLIAKQQNAGRGRRGRIWQSWPQQAGASLTFSTLWRFGPIAHSPTSLSLVAGLALARAIEALGGKTVRLKWPNDVLAHGAKLAGILVELASNQPRQNLNAVVGIGINLQLPTAVEINTPMPITDLAHVLNPLPASNIILAQILIELDQLFALWQQSGLAPLRAAWRQRDHFAAQAVRLTDGQQNLEGHCLDIDEDGALLLQTSQGIERILCGDLSLRTASASHEHSE